MATGTVRKKSFLKWTLVLLAAVVPIIASAYFFRIPLATWLAKSYFQTKNIRAEFKIETLDWREILITGVDLDGGILIPKIHILREPGSARIAGISSLVVDVTSIDVWTTKKLAGAFAGDSSPEDETPPPQFLELRDYCDRLRPTTIHLSVKKLIHEKTEIPLDMKLTHEPGDTTTRFSFSGEKLDYPGNGKFGLRTDDYSGNIELVCGEKEISVTASPIHFSISRLTSTAPFFEMSNSKLISEKLRIAVDETNKATIHVPLQFKVAARTKTQKIKAQIPDLVLSGTYFLDSSQKSSINLVAKKFSMSTPYAVDVRELTAEISTVYDESQALDGDLKILGVTYKNEKLKPLVQNVDARARLQKTQNSANVELTVSDKTKNLALNGLQIIQTNGAIALKFDKKAAKLNLNSQITDLLPVTKDHIKTLSGTLSLGGLINYKDGELDGYLQIDGKNIDVESEYGNATGAQFSHDVTSFKTFASSPGRTLTVQNVFAGKSLDNIALTYQVHSLRRIVGNKLHVEYEGAHIDAAGFTVNPMAKELSDFRATIKKLPLASVLALAAGPLITAEGTLSGFVKLELENKVPTVRGKLNADAPGWVRYRKQGEKQQTNIPISGDAPMAILTSYLYNFYYKELDLELKSNRRYQMNALLIAFGNNPDYQKGKPLKLKINFEQNVLAAIQSMMLSYNLPNRLKEKLEKAGE